MRTIFSVHSLKNINLGLLNIRSLRSCLSKVVIAALIFALMAFPANRDSFAQDPAQGLEYAQGLSAAFAEVSKQIRPSVVNINSVKRASPIKNVPGNRQPQQLPPGFPDPFREFFGDEMFERFFRGQRPDNNEGQMGLGTGVITDKEGHILTNNHVIGDADDITVRLSDTRTFKATVVGKDPKTDLAVIKINAPDLVPAKLGDSDTLKIGEWVVASGNPFGLDNTITAGIVSAKGRSNVGISDYEDFIQTDAAINPGNSGGPLVNLLGEVVGINSAIYSRSGGYMGIGFAIPIKMAKTVLSSLISDGKVVRGWLGVAIQNLDEDMAESFGYKSKNGALIGDVTKAGPADKAGLMQGDIITKFDGIDVQNVTELRNQVASTKPGQEVPIEVVREGQTVKMTVKVQELEPKDESNIAPVAASFDLGVSLRELTPEIQRELGLEQKEGLAVTEILPGSLADRAGLQIRDIIISVNGKKLSSVKEFERYINDQNLKKGVRLVVLTSSGKGAVQRFVLIRSDR
jgi:serine protease Do